MNFKLCVCDLDGTILNSQSKISPRDLSALLRLSDKGVKLVVATGRSELQILEILSELKIDTPVITCNGGVVKYRGGGKVIHSSVFKPETADNIVKYCFVNKLDFLLYTPDYIYHSPNSERINFFRKYNEGAKDEFKVPIKSTDELPKDNPYAAVSKVLICDNVGMIPIINEKFNADGSLTIVSSGKNLIDIMPANTSKGNALVMVAGELGIPIPKVVAFGDSPNDESLLRAAGFSVAMGNAKEYIKQFADFVTKSNDDAGVAFALKKLIL